MMSKTHIGIGIAAALLIAPPAKSEVLLALMGGALGCLFCDIDLGFLSRTNKSLKPGWKIVFSIILSTFILDSIFFKSILLHFSTKQSSEIIFGFILFAVQCFLSMKLPHRTYSHSIMAGTLTTLLVVALAKPIWKYYAVSFASHIFLDLFNRKPITLFYPFKYAICFNLCYADGVANTVLMFIGVAACAALVLVKADLGILQTVQAFN